MIEKFGINMSISNLTKGLEEGRSAYLVRDRMRKALADKIVDVYCKETTKEFHTEYRMEVVVATQADYWKDVQDMAARFNRDGFASFTY